MNRGSGEIYFIQEMPFMSETFPTLVKIGCVEDRGKDKSSYARLKKLQTGNSRRFLLSDDKIVRTHLVKKVEKQMHGRYARKRVLLEWFEIKSKNSLSPMIATATELAIEMKDRVLIEEQVDALKKLSDSDLESEAPFTRKANDVATELCIEDKKILEINRIEKIILGKLRSAFDFGLDVRDALTIKEKKEELTLDTKSLKSDHPDLYESYQDQVEVRSTTFSYTKFRNSVSIEQAHDYEDFISTIKEIENSVEQIVDKEDAYSLNRQVLELTEIKAHLEWSQYRLKQQLQIECGENLGIEGICTWPRRIGIKKEFNKDAFEESNKELFHEYEVENPPTISLTRWQIRPSAPTLVATSAGST